jgi:DNA-binding SARP family transcriptional activator
MDPENYNLLRTDFPSSYLILGEINIFLGNPEAAGNYLTPIISHNPADELPYARATAHALLGYIQFQKGRQKEAARHFEFCESILTLKGYQNLDICDPQLLRDIGRQSGLSAFGQFPRLKSRQPVTVIGEELSPVDLEIRTFGVFRLFVRDIEIDQEVLNRQKRVIDLLKLLIVFRHHGIAKEVVYEIFWTNYTYKNARDNLNTLIYRLRKILGDACACISADMSTIYFHTDKIRVDADQFTRLCRDAKTAEGKKEYQTAIDLYSRAALLYSGDFLESALYIDQIRDERENLKTKYKQALLSLAKLNLSLARFADSLEWTQKLIGIDPVCEPAYRLFMYTSALTENKTEIPRTFEKLKNNLLEKFNITPDRKTEQLKISLLSGNIPAGAAWERETLI